MELANFIHPVLGLLTGLCILTAYSIRLFGIQKNGLHYTLGITALILLVLAVLRALAVAGHLIEAGVETPAVMPIHGFVGMSIGFLLIIQLILGLATWRAKPNVPQRTFLVHTLIGPLLALMALVQIVLGVVTLIGLMG